MKKEMEEHLRRSEELILVAEELCEREHWADAVSRAYYAMFHAATAVLLNMGTERASHRALIAAFGEHVAKPGLMDREFHRYLMDAFAARGISDYFPSPDITPGKARETLDRAREFLSAAKNNLQTGASGGVV